VRLVSVAQNGSDTAVRLDVSGTAYDVVVRRTTGESPQLLTCRAVNENPAPAYEVLRMKRAE
jgi:hypothetical protein